MIISFLFVCIVDKTICPLVLLRDQRMQNETTQLDSLRRRNQSFCQKIFYDKDNMFASFAFSRNQNIKDNKV